MRVYKKKTKKKCYEPIKWINDVPGITFPLNLIQPSAHIWPSKYEPYIFLHCAQFRKQIPTISKSPAESVVCKHHIRKKNQSHEIKSKLIFSHIPPTAKKKKYINQKHYSNEKMFTFLTNNGICRAQLN